MQGAHAIVTGSASGIGRAIADKLAQDGFCVALLDRNLAQAQRAADAIAATGGKAAAFACDVSQQSQVTDAVDQARKRFGPVHILVNGAGVPGNPGLPFTNNTEEDWDLVLNVNLKSVFFLAKCVADDMIAAKDGRIVNISSITGVISAPFLPPYSVSKAAINSLTKILARDLAPHGIAVNAVCPGFVWTELWSELGEQMIEISKGAQGANSREVFDGRVNSLIPMRREQSPQEIADTVAFLCSHSARNITGQIISVDGGVTI